MPRGRPPINIISVRECAKADVVDAAFLSVAPQIRQLSTGSDKGNVSLTATNSDSSTQTPVVTGLLNREEGSILALHFEDVTEAIDQLFKLASQVCSPATRKLRADTDLYGDIGLDVKATYVGNRERVEQQGIGRILLGPRKELYPLWGEDTNLKLDWKDQHLVQRLQRANHARRQQMKYWKELKTRSIEATLKPADFAPLEPLAQIKTNRQQEQSPLYMAPQTTLTTQPSVSKNSPSSSFSASSQKVLQQVNQHPSLDTS